MNLFNPIFVTFCLVIAKTLAYYDANCESDRTTIVHLFEWRFDDIAEECERFLGPKGFCGVQVSPPTEHIVLKGRPWYERYQPVSYKIYSRSGDEQAFKDMVSRCNDAGVRIYADAIMNHMVGSDSGQGTGTGGSSYDADKMTFNGVPWTSVNFNQKGEECQSQSGDVENFNDVNQIRNCRLYGLLDLNQAKQEVRKTFIDNLNNWISFGVAGFRIDVANHMWPNDLKQIFQNLKNLNTKWFKQGARPFIFQEVIDMGNEAVKASEYYQLGRVTEFNYGKYLTEAFKGIISLKAFKNLGEGFGYLMPNDNAHVFVDMHDNQRGHGNKGQVLTFEEPRLYKMANSFMLSWPYGQVCLMSSFYFETDADGPPSDANENIKRVTINSDQSCGNGWVCEHRWRPIANMVQFRDVSGSEPVANWWDNDDAQIAFSRGSRAFFVINADGSKDLNADLQTGMPAGSYCDVISGEKSSDGNSCSGKTITVDQTGKTLISIQSQDDEPMVAIHLKSRLN